MAIEDLTFLVASLLMDKVVCCNWRTLCLHSNPQWMAMSEGATRLGVNEVVFPTSVLAGLLLLLLLLLFGLFLIELAELILFDEEDGRDGLLSEWKENDSCNGLDKEVVLINGWSSLLSPLPFPATMI